jgi:hypothetical protein
VNALKRNLVQESVRGCKQELLVLLGDGRQHSDKVLAPRWRRDRDDLIEERLSALVQVCVNRLFFCFYRPSSFISLILCFYEKTP